MRWSETDQPGDELLKLASVRVLTEEGELLFSAPADSPVIVEIEVDLIGAARVAVGFDLETEDGTVVLSSFLPGDRAASSALKPGRNRLRATIPGGLLNNGRFTVGSASFEGRHRPDLSCSLKHSVRGAVGAS